jgi:two-component system response regulator YesN
MPSVLIVDDEELSRIAVRRLLARLFPDVTIVGEAENGRAAIEMALALAPDIILMDIRVPVVHGLDAAERILQSRPRTRIIILSAYDSFSFAQRAINLGLSGYLLKPAAEEEFREVFHNALLELAGAERRAALPVPLKKGARGACVYPYDEETAFFRAVAAGDSAAVRSCAQSLLAHLHRATESDLACLREYGIELFVSLRRELKKLGFGAESDAQTASNAEPGRFHFIPSARDIQSAPDEKGVMALLEGTLASVSSLLEGLKVSDPRARINAALVSCVLRDLSLETIADMIAMSPAHLSRLFKELYGVKFVDYIAARRIEAAQEILKNESPTIDELSRRVGYSDASYFAQLFKERTGLTPRAYARAVRSGELRRPAAGAS